MSITRKPTMVAVILALPVLFVIKDIVATVAVLSTEPGITAKGALYYRIAMLPGTLWFGGGAAMVFNFFFSVVVGLLLYLTVKRKKLWLLAVPVLVLFLKDMFATAVLAISTPPGTTATPSLSYAIALLPGSALEKFGDAIVFNLLIGLLLGLVLYLFALRRNRAMQKS